MTLVLPAGQIPTPIEITGDDLLFGSRVTRYRFDLLDHEEAPIGELRTVKPGGSVTNTAESSIKGGGSITVLDDGTDIDWLNVRIAVHAIISRAQNAAEIEVPCGVWLCAAPTENWSAIGGEWNIELLDKLSILDSDVVADPITGVAETYSLAAGTNIMATVVQLIIDAGETAPAIEPSALVTSGPLTWEVGTTRLRIINDLLGSANYLSIWVDGEGQYQVTPYVAPHLRAPVYTSYGPFTTESRQSAMSPEWSWDKDIYSIPNRYVVIGVGDESTPAYVAVATNTDPTSPYSYPSRGRWITQVETGVEATSTGALDSYASRQLSNATSVAGQISAKHLFLPDLLINTVVRFVNPDAGIDTLCTVKQTSIVFDPTELSTSSLREVLRSA